VKRAIDFAPFGEVTDPRERARLLDKGLTDLARYWSGDFEPVPVQQPRIPVWVAGEWPYRRPVERALRWDGYFPTGIRAARSRCAGQAVNPGAQARTSGLATAQKL
jgi:hypothetical protein